MGQNPPMLAFPIARGVWYPLAVLFAVLALSGCGRDRHPAATEGRAAVSGIARVFLDELRREPLPPELHRRLGESPHNVFRYVNRAWTGAVCEAFRDEIAAVPAVRLHGDAHLEQYAVTADARGLDDFDDSATGPALIDLVRFLGSTNLAASQRGWQEADGAIADAFFEGYRRALGDPSYLPPDPALVRRQRGQPGGSNETFLAWADSLTKPVSPVDRALFDIQWARAEAFALEANRAATPAQLRVKKLGWLQLGIGSALARKLLIQIEGPSAAPGDDVILEAKEVLTLGDLPCLTVPRSGEVFRTIEGQTQVGRLQHDVLVVVPLLRLERPNMRGWWVKNWQPSYREIEIADLTSPSELVELAHDVGAQLGSANLRDTDSSLAAQKRLAELEAVRRLEPRLRKVADELKGATLEAWQIFRDSPH